MPRLSLLFVLLLTAGMAAASPEPAVGPRLVLRDAGGVVAPSAKVRLAGATRDAVATTAGAVHESACPGGPGILVVSVGSAVEPRAEVLRFVVEAQSDGGWAALAAIDLAPGQASWVDRRIELPPAAEAVRRLRFRLQAPAASTGYWGSLRCNVGAAGDDTPNVIVVSLDTLGAAYLGSFGGYGAASTNLDSFLSRAFSFRRAYATYPNTLVSHASLFSGTYPTTHGVYGSLRDSRVEADLLSTVLRRRGYFNVAFTENAFVSSDFGFDRDFDWYDDGPERGESSFLGDAAYTFGRAGDWLERFGGDAPFLLFVHTYEVHSPYIVRDEQSREIADAVFDRGQDVVQDLGPGQNVEHMHNAGFLPLSADHVRRLEALHVGEIDYLDRVFADFLRRFEALDLSRRTLLVVVADHGDEFDPRGAIGHGETLADVVLHVPMAFYWPGRIVRGDYEPPVSLVDVVPTVLELLGVANPLEVDGRSLAPLLNGSADALPARPVFAELQRAAATCLRLRLSEDCYVGRFVVYGEGERFETSMIPSYQRLSSNGPESPEQALALDQVLASYVTGSPWASRVGWRPRAVDTKRNEAGAIDEVTRQRLEALGYDFE